MNQHAVPQNVTSYQFRLIGDMTIQQFIYLSIGIGAAIFFYYTNLFAPIKWMLILGSAMLGFAVAFLPLEERPLDQWITNYFRAIYKPTLFTWKKEPRLPEYLTYSPSGTILPGDIQEMSRVAALRRQQGLRSYLVTLPSDQANSLDSLEKSAVSGVINMFQDSAAPITFVPTAPLAVTAPSMLNIDIQSNAPTSTNEIVAETPPPQPVVLPPVTSGVVVDIPLHVEKSENLPIPIPDSPSAPAVQENFQSTTLTVEDLSSPSVTATTSSNLPFPSPPTTPNTLVGMVLDQNEKIVDGAIVEVIDESGLPVRATKTNQLGQFFSTTPLRRGNYRLTVEKLGYNFDTIDVVLSGQIVPPLKIQAKS